MAVAVASRGAVPFFLRLLHDQHLGREQHASDRRRVFHGRAGYLDGVDDALGHQVPELTRRGVEAVARTQLGNLGDRHIALVPGVLRDPASRFVERVPHHIHAERLVTGLPKVAEAHPDAYQGATATGDDALLDGRARGGNGVFEPVLLFLQLDLGRGTRADHADAARELGEPLLQLLAVPVRIGVFYLIADLANPVLHGRGVAVSIHDRGRVLIDDDPSGLASRVEIDVSGLGPSFTATT